MTLSEKSGYTKFKASLGKLRVNRDYDSPVNISVYSTSNAANIFMGN